MPLGIESSGLMPGIIERGGAALSETIQNAGKAIQQSLLQQQAFRQARELGSALTQTDPASDKWPQQAAFLTSQFPLAVSSGLAKPILEPMAKAYAGFRAAKNADLTLNRQIRVENLRHTNRMDERKPTPFVTGDGGLLGGGQEPIQDVRPGLYGATLGSMGPAGLMAVQGMDSLPQRPGDLPPLPEGDQPAAVDGAAGMRQRYSQIRAQVADDLIREEQDRQRRGLAPRTAKEGNAAIERQAKAIFDAENKSSGGAADFHESKIVPGVLMTKSGTPFIKGENGGVARPGGLNEERRLNQAERSQEFREKRALQTDQGKALKAALDLLKDREKTEIATLRKFEAEEAKNTDENKAAALRAKVVAQQKLAEETVGRRDATEKQFEKLLNGEQISAPEGGGGSTRIIERNGKKYEVDDASKRVIREVQ